MTQAPKKSKSISNHTIENYIQRVTELTQSAQKIPTNEELEKIVTHLGISPEEIKTAQKQSQDHFTRAQGYFKLKHWDDAIAELQEAIALNPSNLEILNLLANAHLGRWYAKHYRDDEEEIRRRIKQCLEIKPDHQESLSLLAKLDLAIQKHQHRKIFWRAFISIFIGSLVGFFFLNDISFNLLSNRNSKLEDIKLEITKEIEQLRKEQENLLKQFIEKEEKATQVNQENIAKSQRRIEQLEKEVKALNEKIIELQNQLQKLNQSIINLPKNKKINN